MHAAVPFIAVIPARLASARLPGKPLADLGGKPMVVRVAERARASGASRVLIATDAESVLDACRAHGIEALLTRADHPSGTDRLAEVVHTCRLPDDALLVNVQGDEPLIAPRLVAGVAAHLAANPDCAIATAAHPIDDPADVFNPNVVKVVLDARGIALYFSRAPIPWSRDAYQPHWSSPEGQPSDIDASAYMRTALASCAAIPPFHKPRSRSPKRSSSCGRCGTANGSRFCSRRRRRHPAWTRQRTWRGFARFLPGKAEDRARRRGIIATVIDATTPRGESARTAPAGGDDLPAAYVSGCSQIGARR
ncbi:hypothetical protein DFQ30_011192 [Apophysomyces sp. BC1015]|nr:hypothetical protein DFQ30_011192 [Apophysomyces sp. BC1015]